MAYARNACANRTIALVTLAHAHCPVPLACLARFVVTHHHPIRHRVCMYTVVGVVLSYEERGAPLLEWSFLLRQL